MPHSAIRTAPHGLVLLAVLLSAGCVGLPGRYWLPAPWNQTSQTPPPPGEGKTPPDSAVAKAPAAQGQEPRAAENGGPVLQAAYPAGTLPMPTPTPTGTATRPTVTGTPLNLAPGESPAERSLELARKLAIAEEEKLAMTAHAQQLAVLLEAKDRALIQAEREIRAAAEEVAEARADLQRWKKEMGLLRERLRGAELENVATLRSLIAWLERMLDPAKPPEKPRLPEKPEPLKP